MRNVSNAVKSLPDSLAEGMNKVTDNMGRMSERLGQDIKQSILKVTPSQTVEQVLLLNQNSKISVLSSLIYPFKRVGTIA